MSHPQTVRLRLSPSGFGALWTYLKSERDEFGFPMGIQHGFYHWKNWTLDDFLTVNKIQIVDEDDPADPPRWENGKLTTHDEPGLDPWKAFQYWTILILALAVAAGVVGAGVIFALKLAEML